MKRRWTDAPMSDRCTKNIWMRDGSGAQCGRRRQPGFDLCHQHQRMQDDRTARSKSAESKWAAPLPPEPDAP